MIFLSTESEIQKIVDDSFNELFYHNYWWLITIVLITSFIVLILVIYHIFSTKNIKFEENIHNLKKQVQNLEYQIFTIKSSNVDSSDIQKITLEDIAEQLKELKQNINK